MLNMFREVELESLYVPQTANGTNTTKTSSACDMRGYEGGLFVIYYGASLDTLGVAVAIEAALWECETEGGTYTLVADADVVSDVDDQDNAFGEINITGEDSQVYYLSYIGDVRYVKVVVTLTGIHTNGTPLCVLACKKLPRLMLTGGRVDP